MPIRLKTLRRQEEQARKVKDLMQMFKGPNSNSYYQYQYQPTGASSFSNWTTPNIDPKIQKTKDLFEMLHLAR
jgi:hypothetical protein